MSNIIDLFNLQRITTRRAEDAGIHVHFRQGLDAPYYVRDHIYLEMPSPDMTEEELIELQHSYIHEPLHHIRKETLTKIKEMEVGHSEMRVWNVVEDDVMERLHAKEYAGDAEVISKGYESCVIRNAESLLTSPLPNTAEAARIAAMSLLTLKSRTDWDCRADMGLLRLSKAVPSKAVALFDELVDEGWHTRIQEAATIDEVAELSRALYERAFLQPEDEEEQETESEETSDEQGEEEQEPNTEGEGNADEEGHPEEQESPQTGDYNGESQTPPPEQELWDRTSVSQELEEKPYEEHQHIDYNNTPFEPAGEDYCEEIQLANWKASAKYIYASDTELTVEAAACGNKARRLLQTLTRSKIQTERLTGKLHNRNLYRIATPSMPNSDWNARVFKQRKQGIDLDTAITVLVDSSGSMAGQKMSTAIQGAQPYHHVIDRVLHLPTELLMFGAGGGQRPFKHGVVKNFNEQRYTRQDIANRMRRFEEKVGGNQDADAVMWAANRLLQRREKRKLLIVLSDGQPTDAVSGYGTAGKGLKQVITGLKQSGQLELFGIGIMSTAVQDYYGEDCVVVNEVSELVPAIIHTLEQGVLK